MQEDGRKHLYGVTGRIEETVPESQRQGSQIKRHRLCGSRGNAMDRLLFKKCFRCSGFMIYDKFYGLYEHFWGWKCLNCGEIVDHVILENRGLMKTGQERHRQRAGR